jgi:hypothetical protein
MRLHLHRLLSSLLPLMLALLGALSSALAQAGDGPALLDDFEQLAPWHASASDGVSAALSAAPGHSGQALRLTFDFGGGAGYAVARRTLPLVFAPDYAISFWVRADAPLNNFELKLVDASGENVWWVSRPDFHFSRDWQLITFKKRHISFAWGPTADRQLRRSEFLELVISAGRDGGRGTVDFDQLAMQTLAPPAPPHTPQLQVSSALTPVSASALLDGSGHWRSDPASGGAQQLILDFGQAREFGGLILHWADAAHASHASHASRYDLALSDDGLNWRTVRSVTEGNGGSDPILLPESDARFLRLLLHAGPAPGYDLARIELRDLAFGATPSAFFQALAREAPRGRYPRGLSGEQNYWTVLGVDGGHETGLFSEDGALEVARGGFTVEPFVVADGQLVSWADVKISQSLRDNYLPIPSVHWQHPQWRLHSTAFARGTPDQAQLVAHYTLENTSDRPLTLRLVLALRPFQVNPPTQFLNTPPGVSRIDAIDWDGSAMRVNGERRVFALQPPDALGVSSFDAAAIPDQLTGAGWQASRQVQDATGHAAGALAYDVTLAAHASASIGLLIPLTGAAPLPLAESGPPALWLGHAQDAVAAEWRDRLNQVTLQTPPAGQPLIDTLRSSLAHMLMTRDGPVLRPGTRSYARSWIRDGAMMSEALLRLGQDAVARDYLTWYAPYQFASGKVPCCVDRRGADPVPENDSQGEFIFLTAQLWRYTHQRDLLEAMWPHVAAAAAYMETQRQSERGSANLTPARRALFGLLPASISHEGYSAKPMHSYWDDFWGLRGYRDAADIASALGQSAAAHTLARQGDQFERELLDSLQRAATLHHIGYLPGAAELGDFDATSTTVALSPGGLQQRLPPALLHGTFARYWEEFSARQRGQRDWKVYTPYELRTVASFVRLGWRERAHALLDFFMRDRRPAAWNQWAEVVGRDPREPRFLGDMPHGWISSDFIRSTLDLFAYERPADHALVLGAGIPAAWLGGVGVTVQALRTPYGLLDYTLKRQAGVSVLTIPAGVQLPPGGLIFRPPGIARHGTARINGRPASWRDGELHIGALPAVVVIPFAASAVTPVIPSSTTR